MREKLLNYIMDFNKPLYNLNIKKNCNYGLVLVETRKLDYIKNVISNFLFYSKHVNIGLTIFCSNENINFLKQQLHILNGNVNYVLVDVKTESDYNKLLKSEFFYNNIPYDKFLLFQHDSVLLKGIYDYEIFNVYDYIGAGWNENFSFSLPFGGNGGLSFRNKQKCLDLVLSEDPNIKLLGESINEDVYFSIGLRLIGASLSPRSESKYTFVESIYYPLPLGIHNPHPLITDEELTIILDNSK